MQENVRNRIHHSMIENMEKHKERISVALWDYMKWWDDDELEEQFPQAYADIKDEEVRASEISTY